MNFFYQAGKDQVELSKTKTDILSSKKIRHRWSLEIQGEGKGQKGAAFLAINYNGFWLNGREKIENELNSSLVGRVSYYGFNFAE